MEDGRPSQTALTVAVVRAYHYLTEEEPRILSDQLAMQLAGITAPSLVRMYVDHMVTAFTAFGDASTAQAIVDGLTLGVCARSRFAEDQLAAAVARGVEQLVVLGAGLDSTAYRCPELTEDLRVFEVDYPATQEWKRQRLAASGVSIPSNLTFVPFDFERQTLAAALSEGGVCADARSFFSWLGVQPYLTVEAVLATLDVVACFPAGSELVLDLLTSEEPPDRRMADGGNAMLAAIGEPFKSSFDPEQFKAALEQRGFDRVELIGVNEWLQRNAARFGDRFQLPRRPSRLVTAQVA